MPRTPVPEQVSIELQRVVERWHQLPLDRALRYAGPVRELVQRLADEVAEAGGRDPWPVPDLGPAAVMDQLTVMVYDAVESGFGATLADDLADLRRSLA